MEASEVKARGFKDQTFQSNDDFGLAFESLQQLATDHPKELGHGQHHPG